MAATPRSIFCAAMPAIFDILVEASDSYLIRGLTTRVDAVQIFDTGARIKMPAPVRPLITSSAMAVSTSTK